MRRVIYADQLIGVMGECFLNSKKTEISIVDFFKTVEQVDKVLRQNCNTIIHICSNSISAVLDSYPDFFCMNKDCLLFKDTRKDDYYNYFVAGIPKDILCEMRNEIEKWLK